MVYLSIGLVNLHRSDPLFAKLALHRFIIEFVHETRLEDPGIGCEKLWFMFRSRFGAQFKIGWDALSRFAAPTA